MQNVLKRLNEDHHHIAKVMTVFERLSSAIGTDEDVDWPLLAEAVAYLQEYPDAVHHPLEDELFDRVLEKGLTPAERELVHLNLSQHAQIVGATQALADDLERILRDIIVPVDQLQAHCTRYVEMQRTHMRNEQVHLFPLADRLLAEDDWKDVEQALLQRPDPMFEQRLERFAALYRHVAGD